MAEFTWGPGEQSRDASHRYWCLFRDGSHYAAAWTIRWVTDPSYYGLRVQDQKHRTHSEPLSPADCSLGPYATLEECQAAVLVVVRMTNKENQ